MSLHTYKLFVENNKLFLSLSYDHGWLKHLNCGGKGGWTEEISINNDIGVVCIGIVIVTYNAVTGIFTSHMRESTKYEITNTEKDITIVTNTLPNVFYKSAIELRRI